ncbi:aspartate ammonia-lyase [Candidatus Woesearchaeota archaeon]|nr:MAG: aspartate ammonia-lyase [Candidatus Woesearchaeota archaeon]
MRTEKDPLGMKQLPDHAYWGIHTQRAYENFHISHENAPVYFYHAIAQIKLAAARVNRKRLGRKKADAIIKACQEVLTGKFDDQFILDYLQAGMGTPMNMNVNEVIANRALELLGYDKGLYEYVHPNDDVNYAQSTNNVIPTALKIAALDRLDDFHTQLDLVIRTFEKKAKEFSKVLKTGRTHLQDAVPMSLGQEFLAYAQELRITKARIQQASKELFILGIGGNAIGTAVNAPKNYDKHIVKELRAMTKRDFKVAKNHVAMTQFPYEFAHLSSALTLLCIDLTKICNDLRLLSSGPTAGLNEIHLPEVEPGSSIMPGKVNPSILECMNMICYDVMGNHHSIVLASQAGQLELNVMMPLIVKKLLFSIDILTNGLSMLSTKCIEGISANKEQCRKYFDHSNGLATLLNPLIGYDAAAQVAQEALRTKKSVEEIVLKRGLLSKKEWDALIKKSVE